MHYKTNTIRLFILFVFSHLLFLIALEKNKVLSISSKICSQFLELILKASVADGLGFRTALTSRLKDFGLLCMCQCSFEKGCFEAFRLFGSLRTSETIGAILIARGRIGWKRLSGTSDDATRPLMQLTLPSCMFWWRAQWNFCAIREKEVRKLVKIG